MEGPEWEELSIRQNPSNNTWEIGWYESDEYFLPHIKGKGHASREEAEAKIPDLVRSMKPAHAERVRQARSKLKLVT